MDRIECGPDEELIFILEQRHGARKTLGRFRLSIALAERPVRALTQELPQDIRKALTGVPEKEAAMIQLGREFFQTHKVSSATYTRALKALGDGAERDLRIVEGL